MHEIITLQFGQKSNYLATHFWNTQESYFTYSAEEESFVDHDVHFRPGIGADGSETFTPRTLIYDLKGGFGTLRKINALYEIEEPTASEGLWNGPAIIQRQDVIQQHEYQKSLEEGLPPPKLTSHSVRYWSDFNRVYFHPKSIIQLNEYELNSSLTPFENWNAGEELFNSLDKEHDLLDRDLRSFAEEADQMQGIQLISGTDDAWGGFSARYLDRIRDEYGKTPVLFWGLEDSVRTIPREKRFIKLSNTSRSLSEIATQASIFIPLTLPSKTIPSYLELNPNSEWNISALLATAMESISLPSRLKLSHGSRENYSVLSNSININGNQTIANLQMSIDQHTSADNSNKESNTQATDSRIAAYNLFEEDSNSEIRPLDMDFSPPDAPDQSNRFNRNRKSHIFGQTEIVRTSTKTNTSQAPTLDQSYERARKRAAGLTISQRKSIPLPFPLLSSFPGIYHHIQDDSTINLTTSLSTTTAVASRLKSLQHIVNRAVGVEEREALSNSLGEMAEAYEEGWSSGSDEGDD
ncbi:Tubulin nucleotide-binding protein [Glarea lozoyensis ATCC 20868]|uniref:Tubulin nucleotide-binding protein n=1 Tax=Glarea lozoyensis (strain ATCC 20868 / MF5171) TaxID=1116229 RepID=S3DG78_GLAL2|nr:Tubulin nucleotide-binding protein [Glarea lozoyensis ATCC 20868]EPE36710.1 Tubulin nucleotide-binding protein [Glarea lozoyensis ATCC 20868]